MSSEINDFKRFLTLFCFVVLLLAFRVTSLKAEPWTFERVVVFASSHSPEVEIAKARISVAQAQLGQADASLWPHLQFQTGYTQSNNPASVFGSILNQRSYNQSLNFNNVPATDNLAVRGVLSFPIYTGGRDTARREAATANFASVSFEKRIIERDFSIQAAVTYLEILKASQFIKAMESSVRAFEANEKAVKGMFSAGTVLKTELLDVQVQLAQSREELIRAKNARALMKESLQSLLGTEDAEFEIVVAPIILEEPEKQLSDVERLELKTLQAKKEAVLAQKDEATAGYLPRVALQGIYEYDKGWKFNNDGNNYTVGVVGEWDIWNGMLTGRKEDEAIAQLEAVVANERRLKKTISLEESQARIKLQEAKDTLEVVLKSEKLARESAELTRLRFAQGLVPSTQLIDSERALTTAEVKKAEAQANRQISLVLLRRSLDLPPIELSKGVHKND